MDADVPTYKRPAEQLQCPMATAAKRVKIEDPSNGTVNDAPELDSFEDNTLETTNGSKDDDPMGMSSFSGSFANEPEDLDADEFDSDLDIDEILEADVDEAVAKERGEYQILQKTVLKLQPKDLFNELPDNWIEVTHDSGLIVYLHKPTRVCTFGRPYFLGPGSARHHAVQPSAIPCYYQKILAEEAASNKQAQKEHEAKLATGSDNNTHLLNSVNAPLIKIVDVGSQLSKDLTPKSLHEYAVKGFEFETISFRRYKEWTKARQHFKDLKRMSMDKAKLSSSVQRPTLPSDAKLITIPCREKNKLYSKNFALNPKGKTALAILHEYTQKILKSTVEYDVFDVPNIEGAMDANNHFYTIAKIRISPLGQTIMAGLTLRERLVIIQAEYEERLKSEGRSAMDIGKSVQGVVVVGQGKGTKKKASRMSAAVNALQVLIPELTFNKFGVFDDSVDKHEEELEMFDLLSITDTRVPGFSHRLGQPMPYAVLQSCIERCRTFCDTSLDFGSKKLGHSKTEITLKVGDKEVVVTASNVVDGKQKAAQKMLQLMYPQFEKYGTIMRLYDVHNKQTLREIRQSQKDFQKATSVADQESKRLRRVQQNEAFLKSLRDHMLEYAKKGSTPSSGESEFLARSKPILPEQSNSLADVSRELANQEGDYFLRYIPQILDVHKQQQHLNLTKESGISAPVEASADDDLLLNMI